MSDRLIWEGRELATMHEIMSVVVEIAMADEKLRATAFMAAYEKIAAPDVVRKNIGYCTGYYDRETAKKIFEIFDVRHPIFGRTYPDPKWALELGQRIANGVRPPRKTT